MLECNTLSLIHSTWKNLLTLPPSRTTLSYMHLSQFNKFKDGSYMVPSLESQVTWGLYVQSHLLRAWKLGLTTLHGAQVPSMHAWPCFLEVRLVLRVGSSKKLDPTLKTSPTFFFASNNQDPTLRFLKARKLGLGFHVWDLRLATWDPMQDHEGLENPPPHFATSKWFSPGDGFS